MLSDVMVCGNSTKEAELMRLFYGLGDKSVMDSQVVNTDILDGSCVTSCHLGDEKYVTKYVIIFFDKNIAVIIVILVMLKSVAL